MIIRRAKRSNTSYCRICTHYFKRGEMYFKLTGSMRVMRANMCINHFKLAGCEGCTERLKCLTNSQDSKCIVGEFGITRVEEVNW
jgi:hypothetical protein